MELLKWLIQKSWKLHTFTIVTNIVAWWLTRGPIHLPEVMGGTVSAFAIGDVVFWTCLTGLASLAAIVYDIVKFTKR